LIDESIMARPAREFLSARQVCARLGIKPQTLYAYVSRGLVRSVAAGRGRARAYLTEDVERLKARHDARAGHGPVAGAALRWGEPVLDTTITGIDARGPRYRGHVATELAEAGVPFEAVATLLWTGVLPPSPPTWDGATFGIDPASLAPLLPRDGGRAAALSLLVAALGASDGARFAAPVDREIARAQVTVRRLAAGLALPRAPKRAEAALRAPSDAHAVAVALGAHTEGAAAIDRILVLSADHELNVSTFAARVAASAGADLYACLGAAWAAFSGPAHGGSPDRLEAFVAEIGAPERAYAALRDRLRRGDAIPGFGHPLYTGGDPRGAPLLALARAIDPGAPTVRTLLALAAAMEDEGRELPNVDLGLVAVTSALGLPRGAASAIFGLGRCAGWVAHVLEQRAAGHLLRPRARYVGP
jgi:citrate synthase